MSKLKISNKVVEIESGKVGVVRARNVVHENKTTTVEYMVDFGTKMDGWKVLTKNQLKKVVRVDDKRKPIVKEYDNNGQKLVLVGIVEPKSYWIDNCWGDDWFNKPEIKKKGRMLTVGFSIYNGVDEYNPEIGIKYAKHRAKVSPFAKMESTFSGEFNDGTVNAILDAKAEYIKEHWNEFYRPRN